MFICEGKDSEKLGKKCRKGDFFRKVRSEIPLFSLFYLFFELIESFLSVRCYWV